MPTRKTVTTLSFSTSLCAALLLSVSPAHPSSSFELDTREIEGKKPAAVHKTKAPKPHVRKVKAVPRKKQPEAATKLRVVHLSGRGGGALFDGIMGALAIKSEKGKLIEAYGDKARTQFYSISADRYFEENGRRYAVNCSGMDPYNYSLYRILELQGYQVIHIKEGDSANSVVIAILSRLGRPYRQGKYIIRSASNPRKQMEVSGVLLLSAGGNGEDMLFSDRLFTQGEERWVKKDGALAGK